LDKKKQKKILKDKIKKNNLEKKLKTTIKKIKTKLDI
jgi:hypothetical protein